ncbi:TPA: hypothetical protein ACSJUJ_000916 [Legionella pneumophila]|nr:hypothetical protein [Legionella pneumophila]MCZ4703899.1 hypothetical protein [Legionella pneumophila]MCZ4738641.1 hypothetical protein [Legionella pneumophila]WII13935.1 hypothetical protein PT256_11890 [Legionella pneumophila]CZG33995.1 Uncharacterised protein [Legionella pneumophila]CZG36837.1 Uncharacterised protein [Legionella pneumophila]
MAQKKVIVLKRYETINAESIISHLRLVRRQHGTKGTIYII